MFSIIYFSFFQDNGNLKNKQMGLIFTESLLYSKGNNKQNEKTAHRLGENIYKLCDR